MKIFNTQEASPKTYCKITINAQTDSPKVDFYGLSEFYFFNELVEQGKRNGALCLSLYQIYNFLAYEKFVPVSDTFFYRDMEKGDQKPNC